MEQSVKIVSFTQLDTYKVSHELVLAIYEATKSFPEDEKFGLTSQLRRAAISITSNIAEGFSRKSSKERLQFYAVALRSVTEVQSQLLISRDLGYISKELLATLSLNTVSSAKLLKGLMRSIRISSS